MISFYPQANLALFMNKKAWGVFSQFNTDSFLSDEGIFCLGITTSHALKRNHFCASLWTLTLLMLTCPGDEQALMLSVWDQGKRLIAHLQ